MAQEDAGKDKGASPRLNAAAASRLFVGPRPSQKLPTRSDDWRLR